MAMVGHSWYTHTFRMAYHDMTCTSKVCFYSGLHDLGAVVTMALIRMHKTFVLPFHVHLVLSFGHDTVNSAWAHLVL